jgi:hypothetical protein
MSEEIKQDEQGQHQAEGVTEASMEERDMKFLRSALTEFFDEQLKKNGATPIEK